jgi:LmbE family N-acetylglucosaminyl deacetylase
VAASSLLLASGAWASGPVTGPAILQELRAFRETGSVLYLAAHPDDENTQLITYLARGRDYRTAYLSLTRGDGGQNVLGPEFGDELGLIRTEELLSARRVDGGLQYFSRARDFGFSKDYRQTLTKWDHQEVLADVVRVIRTFRPDVVITRFSPEPANTHGHHTASAALALEAFALSGDPKAFPEQLGSLAPWRPRRLLWNSFGPGRGIPEDSGPGVIHMAIDGTDPVTGASFAMLAARSRSMHQTQGFANFSVAAGGGGARTESFRLLAGEPADTGIMDGVDTTWGRIPGGAGVGSHADEAVARFNPADPAASVPVLLLLKAEVAALPQDPLVVQKGLQLDSILQHCLGLTVETTVPSAEIVPGEALGMHHTALVRSAVPVKWMGVRYPGTGPDAGHAVELRPGEGASFDAIRILPVETPPSQPYWLREEGTEGMFRVGEPALIGMPENPPAVPLEDVFEVGGQTLLVPDEPVRVTSDPAKGDLLRRLDVIPPVSLHLSSSVELFAPGATREIAIDLLSSRALTSGKLQLDAPPGWKVSPASLDFDLAAAGARARFTFAVTAPAEASAGNLSAWTIVGGTRFSNQRVEIHYPHIPPLLLQPAARLRVVSLDLAIRGRKVGYLPGAGDSVAESLAQMGYAVTPLSGADLNPEKLRDFDAVVIGIRAFNTRTDLASGLPALFAYAESGGTVVEQYNTPALQTQQLAPFALKLSRDLPRFRVTDEHAVVSLLAPDNPAFTGPNRIVPADFDGWVQERGLNFPSEWDKEHFVSLLACSDTGEPPLTSGLLVAKYGRGYFVYTGLSFFRQLPAGVPGAYRLFANLVSLGK